MLHDLESFRRNSFLISFTPPLPGNLSELQSLKSLMKKVSESFFHHIRRDGPPNLLQTWRNGEVFAPTVCSFRILLTALHLFQICLRVEQLIKWRGGVIPSSGIKGHKKQSEPDEGIADVSFKGVNLCKE